MWNISVWRYKRVKVLSFAISNATLQFTDVCWLRQVYMVHNVYLVKTPLHRAATFVPPLSDQKIDQDAQRSPIPRKFSFYVIAAERPLCVLWTTQTAVVAQQVVQRRQSGGRTIATVTHGLPWSLNGGTAVATVIAQWTLLVGQMKHNGGTREAEASLKLIHSVYNTTHFVTSRPMADFCASILGPRRCVCLQPASFERPVSDPLPRRPLCDCFDNAQTSRRLWRPWEGLNVLCATLERPRQTFGLLCAFNGDLESFVVAQGRHKGQSPCGKGVLNTTTPHSYVKIILQFIIMAIKRCWFGNFKCKRYQKKIFILHKHCSWKHFVIKYVVIKAERGCILKQFFIKLWKFYVF